MAANNRRANFMNFLTHTQKFVFLFNNVNGRLFVQFSLYSFKKWEMFFTTLNKIVNMNISTKKYECFIREQLAFIAPKRKT